MRNIVEYPYENLSDDDLENKSKEELIEVIKYIRENRAFSYKDQIKLQIIDNTNLSVWASDRDCIIKFWSNQCESLYGYSEEDAIGKDFVNLFVAENEKDAARKDQIDIIDNGTIFHNLANDQGKNDNVLHLITICNRIKDPKTGEYWNAELGLIIDYLDDERQRLENVINESKKKSYQINSLNEMIKSDKRHIRDEVRIIKQYIKRYENEALKKKDLETIKIETKKIKDEIKKVIETFDSFCKESMVDIKDLTSVQERNDYLDKYMDERDSKIEEHLQDINLEVMKIYQEINVDSSNISDHINLLDIIYKKYTYVEEKVKKELEKINLSKEKYSNDVGGNPSKEKGQYKVYLDDEKRLNNLLSDIENEKSRAIDNCKKTITKEDIDKFEIQIEYTINNFENRLHNRSDY